MSISVDGSITGPDDGHDHGPRADRGLVATGLGLEVGIRPTAVGVTSPRRESASTTRSKGEPNVTPQHRRSPFSLAARETPRRSPPHRSSMVRNLLMYVAICVVAIALFWLAARLIGLNRPSSGPTGHAWLDAEDAFDHARREHHRHQVAAVLRGQPHRLDLPILSGVATLGGPRIHTEVQIPIRDIVGTAGAGDGKFDRDFLPTDERSRGRFQALVLALREGQALPPIEAYRLHGRYWIADGHHRVAVARALGEESIAAYVTDISGW